MTYPSKPAPAQGSQNISKTAIEKNAGINQKSSTTKSSTAKSSGSGRKFDPTKHQRAPKGSTGGGRFSKGSTNTNNVPGNSNPVGQGEGMGATTSQRVSDLQTRLNQMGFHLAVDGRFGPKTRAAVISLQQRYGLKQDGLVGPKTTAALRGHREQQRQRQHLKRQLAASGKPAPVSKSGKP